MYINIMGFITGLICGMILVLILLPIFSKYIMNYAAKRKLNNLMGEISSINNQFEDIVKKGAMEEKIGE